MAEEADWVRPHGSTDRLKPGIDLKEWEKWWCGETDVHLPTPDELYITHLNCQATSGYEDVYLSRLISHLDSCRNRAVD